MLPQKRSNFDSFSTYMHDKEAKLREQFHSTVTIKSTIFQGICVHVNGRTQPPIEELRQMVLEHGGLFEQYYHSHRVTHVLCTHIPRAKEQNASKDFKSKLIKPDWIVESVRAGRKLDEQPFKLYSNNAGLMDKYIQRERVEPSDDANFDEIDDIDLLADMIDMEDSINCNIEVDCNSEEFNEKDTIIPHLNRSNENMRPQANTNTSNNEGFLSDFYQNSRLHHLSTWRSEAALLSRKLMQSRSKNHPTGANTTFMHVDLDCFFVQVSAQKYCPGVDFSFTPLAVCHSQQASAASTSDISSCNYAARGFGIKNGMYVKEAVRLCPHLQVIPYDFDGYRRVMTQFYGILAEWAHEMESVSCDEAYITVQVATDQVSLMAEAIRTDIKQKCGVDASVGAGPSMLCARMATRLAKPAGQFCVSEEEAEEFMSGQEIAQLPGVGPALMEKITQAWPGVKFCGELAGRAGLLELQSKLGVKNGLKLAKYLQGQDDRQLKSEKKRQSVGSEVSWGVRFASAGQMKRFVDELAGEVWRRLMSVDGEGSEDGEEQEAADLSSLPLPASIPKKISIKLYKKRAGAGEPKKYLGRGVCDVFHRSKTFTRAIQKCSLLQSEVWTLIEALMKASQIGVDDVRGVGVFLSDFNGDEGGKRGGHVDVLDAMMSSNRNDTANPLNNNADAVDAIISASNVDPEVWAALPEDIRAELQQGGLFGNINRSTTTNTASSAKEATQQKNNKKKGNKDTLTLTQLWGQRADREDAEFKRRLAALPESEYDRQVLLALPKELQLEIISEYEGRVARSTIKPSESVINNTEQTESKPAITFTDRLPIEFADRSDWSPFEWYLFLKNNLKMLDMAALENVLRELCLQAGGLKVVRDSCCMIKQSLPNGEEIVERIRDLVYQLYGSHLRID